MEQKRRLFLIATCVIGVALFVAGSMPAVSQEPAKGTVRKTNAGVEMVYVPAGEFTMGNNVADQKPIHKVFLDGYWIGKNLITVAQFRAFCKDAEHSFDWDKNKPEWGWIDNHPIVNVDRSDVFAYCKWAGGTMPTEAQWEKAARGEDGRTYPWGNEWNPDFCAHGIGQTRKQTEPVGSFSKGASPYGCLDMSGNVWQWCRDFYSGVRGYEGLPEKNPVRTSSDGNFLGLVLRGGSWRTGRAESLSSSFRYYRDADYRNPGCGFRLAGADESMFLPRKPK